MGRPSKSLIADKIHAPAVHGVCRTRNDARHARSAHLVQTARPRIHPFIVLSPPVGSRAIRSRGVVVVAVHVCEVIALDARIEILKEGVNRDHHPIGQLGEGEGFCWIAHD